MSANEGLKLVEEIQAQTEKHLQMIRAFEATVELKIGEINEACYQIDSVLTRLMNELVSLGVSLSQFHDREKSRINKQLMDQADFEKARAEGSI